MTSDEQPTQPITDAELMAINYNLNEALNRCGELYLVTDAPKDMRRLLVEVDRLRDENGSIFADLLQYSQLHWEDCPLDAEDCYLCEGYERIRANAADWKAAGR